MVFWTQSLILHVCSLLTGALSQILLFAGGFLAPTSPRPRGLCGVGIVGDDGVELLDGEVDGGHLVLPASAVD